MKLTRIIAVAFLLVFVLLATTAFGFADVAYTIQRGDTLSSIAVRFGTTVQAIVAANNISNPNLIYAGQTLFIPEGTGAAAAPPQASQPTNPPPLPPAGGNAYVVQRGDTLSRIAARHGVALSALIQANNITNPNLIYAGQALVIPGGTGPGGAPTPSPPPSPPPTPPGANLLPNPSFEGGFYNLHGSPELQVPHNWQMEFDQGGAAPGTGIPLLRPESRVLPRWGLPAHEHALFIWNGDWTIKVFKAHAPIGFRMFTDIHLEPGRYRFTGYYFPDLIEGYDANGKVWMNQPQSGEVAFIGPGGGGWVSVTPGVRSQLVQDFIVTAPGGVRLGMAFRTRYAIPNNGFFIDNWSLQRIG